MKKSALDTLGGRLLLGGTSGQAAGGRVPSKLRLQARARGHRKILGRYRGGDGAAGRRHSMRVCSETGKSSVCGLGIRSGG